MCRITLKETYIFLNNYANIKYILFVYNFEYFNPVGNALKIDLELIRLFKNMFLTNQQFRPFK